MGSRGGLLAIPHHPPNCGTRPPRILFLVPLLERSSPQFPTELPPVGFELEPPDPMRSPTSRPPRIRPLFRLPVTKRYPNREKCTNFRGYSSEKCSLDLSKTVRKQPDARRGDDIFCFVVRKDALKSSPCNFL